MALPELLLAKAPRSPYELSLWGLWGSWAVVALAVVVVKLLLVLNERTRGKLSRGRRGKP